jgi:hypothetical protein
MTFFGRVWGAGAPGDISSIPRGGGGVGRDYEEYFQKPKLSILYLAIVTKRSKDLGLFFSFFLGGCIFLLTLKTLAKLIIN